AFTSFSRACDMQANIHACFVEATVGAALRGRPCARTSVFGSTGGHGGPPLQLRPMIKRLPGPRSPPVVAPRSFPFSRTEYERRCWSLRRGSPLRRENSRRVARVSLQRDHQLRALCRRGRGHSLLSRSAATASPSQTDRAPVALLSTSESRHRSAGARPR